MDNYIEFYFEHCRITIYESGDVDIDPYPASDVVSLTLPDLEKLAQKAVTEYQIHFKDNIKTIHKVYDPVRASIKKE